MTFVPAPHLYHPISDRHARFTTGVCVAVAFGVLIGLAFLSCTIGSIHKVCRRVRARRNRRQANDEEARGSTPLDRLLPMPTAPRPTYLSIRQQKLKDRESLTEWWEWERFSYPKEGYQTRETNPTSQPGASSAAGVTKSSMGAAMAVPCVAETHSCDMVPSATGSVTSLPPYSEFDEIDLGKPALIPHSFM